MKSRADLFGYFSLFALLKKIIVFEIIALFVRVCITFTFE